jgi:hypothetical protein
MTQSAQDMLHAALQLPYSVGAHRLLREILSTVTGVPLPETDPPVLHPPVQRPRIPPAPPPIPRPAQRHAHLIAALNTGLVTRESSADWPWPWNIVMMDVGNLRTKGYDIRNVGSSHKAAYILTPDR